MTLCALCPRQNRCVEPDGPMERGGILFIGEAPGSSEDKQGRPFVGKTGDEVNHHYLPLAGLRRDSVTFHNAISCLPVTARGKLDPKKAAHLSLLDSCANANLYPLIERMHPRVIVAMGSFAIRAVSPGLDIELHHGIPAESPFGIPVFPMFHPALGLHSPKQMLYIRTDWQRLRRYLAGTLLLPYDDYPNPDYREVKEADEIEELDPTQPLAGDTESGGDGPYCLTYSQAPGTGRLIRASRLDLLAALQAKLCVWESRIIFHNWLYDWPVTEAMGLSLPIDRLVDTMVRVYHLGNLPQGMKALAFRELGMAMEDFTDVVRPHSVRRVLEYYRLAYAEEWPKPEPELVRDEEGRWKLYKPQSMNTKLKRFFTDYQKDPNKDPIEMWDNWESSHAMIEGQLGPWMGMDIRDVPFDLALRYACRDADATLRLWHLIRKMPAYVRRFDQSHWVEKAA